MPNKKLSAVLPAAVFFDKLGSQYISGFQSVGHGPVVKVAERIFTK